MLKGSRKQNTYQFPTSETISITRSDLHIQLHKYSEAVKSKFTIFDTLAIVGLWSPIISGGFSSIAGISPDTVKGGYFVLAVVVSAIILYAKLFKGSEEGVSHDPEEMASKIVEKCK